MCVQKHSLGGAELSIRKSRHTCVALNCSLKTTFTFVVSGFHLLILDITAEPNLALAGNL